jgi:hypothetical protein
MTTWALQGQFSRVAFLCISIDDDVRQARAAAVSFGSKLQMREALNYYCEVMPDVGQLGCSGFIGLTTNGAVLAPATPAYLQFGQGAFR